MPQYIRKIYCWIATNILLKIYGLDCYFFVVLSGNSLYCVNTKCAVSILNYPDCKANIKAVGKRAPLQPASQMRSHFSKAAIARSNKL